MHNVYRDGRVHVLAERCATCVFRPGNKMSLNPGRVKAMVTESVANDSAIVCHSTLYQEGVDNAVCKGFFDSHWQESAPLRLAVVMQCIAEVEVP